MTARPAALQAVRPQVCGRTLAVTVCVRCEDRHMRPYPEDPGDSCGAVWCECWCNDDKGTASA